MPKHDDEKQFQAEQDVRTMVEFDSIKKDEKRLGRAMKEARTQLNALKKIEK